MQLILDMGLIVIIFLFSYAFGRKSDTDGEPVIPRMVTLFTLFIIIGIYLIINLPSIIEIMASYTSR